MRDYLLIASGALAILGGLGHTWIGEKVIIGPLYAEETSAVLKNPRTRDILRAVFHIPSAAWAILGAALICASLTQARAPLLVWAAAGIFLVSGFANLIALRRAHPGAIVFISAGTLALASLYS